MCLSTSSSLKRTSKGRRHQQRNPLGSDPGMPASQAEPSNTLTQWTPKKSCNEPELYGYNRDGLPFYRFDPDCSYTKREPEHDPAVGPSRARLKNSCLQSPESGQTPIDVNDSESGDAFGIHIGLAIPSCV